MNKLPFEKLRSSMEFQRLCADLLLAEGVENIRGFGTGPDQGNDFMVDLPVASPLGTELHLYVVQCKWYKTGRNVGEDEIGDVIGYLDLHEAVGLLFITSSQFSGTAVTKMEAINRSNRHPYKVKYWDGNELSRRLHKYPDIISRYWYQSNDGFQIGGELPEYNFAALLNKYSISDYERRELRVETFPITPDNKVYVPNLLQYAERYRTNPPKVTIIEGEIGAGKTGFALGLLNEKYDDGYTVAQVRWSEYNDLYRKYAFHESKDYLPFIQFCREVDFLLLDDFGMFLTDKSNTLVEAANALRRIVQERINLGKYTIITVPKEYAGKTIRDYLEYLRGIYPVVYVGNKDLRPYMKRSDEFTFYQQGNEITEGNSVVSRVLGKDWLIEKYDLIEKEIAGALEALLRPEEEDLALRRHLKEGFGDPETRQDEIQNRLLMAKRRIHEYRSYIDTIEFKAIIFDSDGDIKVIK